jgi:hypothetical protein
VMVVYDARLSVNVDKEPTIIIQPSLWCCCRNDSLLLSSVSGRMFSSFFCIELGVDTLWCITELNLIHGHKKKTTMIGDGWGEWMLQCVT